VITTTNTAYATELLEIKSEINALKALITTAVEQFKTAVASFATPRSPPSTAMDTEVEESPEHHNQNQTQIDLVAVIQDLKNEIVQSTAQCHPPRIHLIFPPSSRILNTNSLCFFVKRENCYNNRDMCLIHSKGSNCPQCRRESHSEPVWVFLVIPT